jgi:tetratricopeptide (TPR) repeat protein
VEKLGHDTLRRILADVTAGMPINDSLERRAGSLKELDAAFDKYARGVAKAYGEKLDWVDSEDAPPLPKGPSTAIAEWLKDRPKSYHGRLRLAQLQMEEKKWPEARKTLEAFVADAPDLAGDDSPYSLLADVLRELKDKAAERKVLEVSAARSGNALQTYRRLIELATKAKDAADVSKQVERFLAVQPLEEFPYRHLADAGEHGGDVKRSVNAARSLIALQPPDKAGAHFRLAKLLHSVNDPEAKRQVLLALEETPRFRDAQRLLLKIVEPAKVEPTKVEPAKTAESKEKLP